MKKRNLTKVSIPFELDSTEFRSVYKEACAGLPFDVALNIYCLNTPELKRILLNPVDDIEKNWVNSFNSMKLAAESIGEKKLFDKWKTEPGSAGDILKSTKPRYNIKTKMTLKTYFDFVHEWVSQNLTTEQQIKFHEYMSNIGGILE